MKFISCDQENALNLLLTDNNCFLTGSPGSGKTFLLKKLIEKLKNDNQIVAITATTGCAACLINGQTINSWGGLGTGEFAVDTIVKNILKFKKITKNWRKTDVLIIDEISMMSKELFEKINSIGKIVRNNNLPFGGLKLIFVGDFNQLSPVNGEFIFKSDLFEQIFEYGIFLNKIYRQNNVDFLNLLNEIRTNTFSKNSLDLLKKIKEKKINENDIIQPTILLPLNKDVEIINNQRLNKIKEPEFIYKYNKVSYITPDKKPQTLETKTIDTLIEKFTNVSPIIKLKKGAQVMLLKNLDVPLGLVNGSLGVIKSLNEFNVVVEFQNSLIYPLTFEQFKVENDDFIFSFEHIPLKIAYALSIHKCQGMSISCCQIDIGKSIFQPQQAYVALSRIIDPEIYEKTNNRGLYIKDYHLSSFSVYNDVINFYSKFNVEEKIEKNSS
jgi:ATP-dependent DNA helicase PIF1